MQKIWLWNENGKKIASYSYPENKTHALKVTRLLKTGEVLICSMRERKYLAITLLDKNLNTIFEKTYPKLGIVYSRYQGHTTGKNTIDILLTLMENKLSGFHYAVFRINKLGEPQPLKTFSECFDYRRFRTLYGF